MSFDLECESASNIGSNFNHWKRSVSKFGPGEDDLGRQLSACSAVGILDITKKDWSRAREVVDEVLDLTLEFVKKEAEKYERLVIQHYMRRGSARDGLKVGAPDEFDVLLQFYIEGLNFEAVGLRNQGKIVAELGEIHISDKWNALEKRFPTLMRKKVFVERDGKILLSSRALQEQVFVSMLDTATQKAMKTERGMRYAINRSINPPTVNITIHVDGKVIDVDVVPGLLIKTDQVPNPIPGGDRNIACPRHYVFKWMTDSQSAAALYEHPSELWRVCTTSYEIYLLDVSRRYDVRAYIITALRVLKAYLSTTKASFKLSGRAPPPITTVLRSYHLKQVAFYCILYLDIEKKISVSGVKEALGYIVDLLQVSLEENRLPHFFHGNGGLKQIIPQYPYDEGYLCFDLYGSKSKEALNQARLSLEGTLREDLRAFISAGNQRSVLMQKFKKYISSRQYFKANPSLGFVVDMAI